MMMLALAALATTASAADHMKAPTGMPLGWRRHVGGVAVWHAKYAHLCPLPTALFGYFPGGREEQGCFAQLLPSD